MSLSSRRAWIEITVKEWAKISGLGRSPRGERGLKYDNKNIAKWLAEVALLTESVDWNANWRQKDLHLDLGRSPHGERGLKFYCIYIIHPLGVSLSSRRAWIEIKLRFSIIISVASVALLTESVDWNRTILFGDYGQKVALLTESVDWNIVKVNYNSAVLGRSPHGERGLK